MIGPQNNKNPKAMKTNPTKKQRHPARQHAHRQQDKARQIEAGKIQGQVQEHDLQY